MRFISGIISIVIGLGALMVANAGLSDYFGGNEAKVEKYETLKSEGVETMALLDSVYSETEIKGISFYTVKYFFDVAEEKYSGEMKFDSPSDITTPIVSVHYMPENPAINTANLQAVLDKSKDNLNSNSDLWLALGVGLFAVFMIYRGIRKFKPEEPSSILTPSPKSNDEFV